MANNCSFVPPPSSECVNHYQMNYREIINLSKTLNRDASITAIMQLLY